MASGMFSWGTEHGIRQQAPLHNRLPYGRIQGTHWGVPILSRTWNRQSLAVEFSSTSRSFARSGTQWQTTPILNPAWYNLEFAIDSATEPTPDPFARMEKQHIEKMATAPNWDGISVLYLRRIWTYRRLPATRC